MPRASAPATDRSPGAVACRLLLSILCAGCSPYRVYWGDVHGHTELSDGQGSPEAYLAYARDRAQLDFVIITDHDFGSGPPWQLSPEAWDHIQDAVDAFTVDHRFVAIAGYEWTSQSKYWTERNRREPGLRLPFEGPAKYYNHKSVYFRSRVERIFAAHDPDYASPHQLAEAVRRCGGLIHNSHPSAGPEGRDQWAYGRDDESVITNTEMAPDLLRHDGATYTTDVEQTVRGFLDGGRKTGFVGGSDTHVGRPEPRTAVLARELTRAAIFEALRHRRCYATFGGRITLDFRINGHYMGETLVTDRPPRIRLRLSGPHVIERVVVIRNGRTLRTFSPGTTAARLDFVDTSLDSRAYYYVRVTCADTDADGNPVQAWSSPIWVTPRDGAGREPADGASIPGPPLAGCPTGP